MPKHKPRKLCLQKSGIGTSGRLFSKGTKPILRPELTPSIVHSDTINIQEPEQQIVIDQPPEIPPPEILPARSKYAQTQQKSSEVWKIFSKKSLSALTEAAAFAGQECCSICSNPYSDERVPAQCRDCHHYNHCNLCIEEMHKYTLFHHPEIWKDGEYIPYTYPQVLFNSRRHPCPRAGEPFNEDMLFVSDSGDLCLGQLQIRYCVCHPLPLQLVELGFWPSTPQKPSVAFSIQFLKLCKFMMLEGHMSLQAICQTFMFKACWNTEQCKTIYKQLTNECFEEFRHCLYKFESDDILTGECPACDKNPKKFYSLDGNFGLVRKKNSGESYQPSKHAGRFFVDQKEVEEYVDRNNKDIEADAHINDCSTFQAGDLLRTKNKAHGLDQTGVFGSICRHGVPKKFLSMKYGERFAYPILIIQKILETTTQSVKPVFIYDIACKLHKYIKSSDDDDVKTILHRADFAVPCWHAYGHGRSCQRTYSTQYKNGSCLTDGEEMERLWSYLTGFSHITKEMTPSHRIDLLSDALIHFGKRKKCDLALTLVKQANKAKLAVKNAKQDIQHLMRTSNQEGFDMAYIHSLSETPLSSPHTHASMKKVNLTSHEKYVDMINKVSSLQEEMQSCSTPDRTLLLNKQIESMEAMMNKIEKENKINHRWSARDDQFNTYLASKEKKEKASILRRMKIVAEELDWHRGQKAKYKSPGQSQAKRIIKQLRRNGKSLHKLVNMYNKAQFKTDGELPMKVEYNNVCTSAADIYTIIENDGAMARDAIISSSVADEAVRLYNKLQRAIEEEDQVTSEMDSFIRYHQSLTKRINDSISTPDSTQFELGRVAILQKQLHGLEFMTGSANELFEEFLIKGSVPDENPLYNSTSDSDDSDTSDFEAE